MDYTLELSLKRLTSVTIAVEMWSRREVKVILKGFISDNSQWGVDTIVKDIYKKINLLPLPGYLQHGLKNVIKGIGSDILHNRDIIKHHLISSREMIEQCAESYVNHLHWTPYGTIDMKKTVEAFLLDQNCDLRWRYSLACRYLCEKHIPFLWSRLYGSNRNYFLGNDGFGFFERYVYLVPSGYFKASEISEVVRQIEMNSGKSLYEYLTESSLKRNYEVLFEHFWQKLTVEEKDRNVIAFAKVALMNSNGILLILLSHMNSAVQTQFFQDYACKILKYLLSNWLRRGFFFATFSVVKDYLSPWDFCHLLEDIASRIENSAKDDNRVMFEKLWNEGSSEWKRFTLENCIFLMYSLSAVRDDKSIRLMFDSATVEGRKKLIYSKKWERFFEHLMQDDNRDFLDVFLRIVLSSEEEIQSFIRHLKGGDEKVAWLSGQLRDCHFVILRK